VAGGGEYARKQEIEVSRDNLATLPAVLVLDYK